MQNKPACVTEAVQSNTLPADLLTKAFCYSCNQHNIKMSNERDQIAQEASTIPGWDPYMIMQVHNTLRTALLHRKHQAQLMHLSVPLIH